MKNLEMSTILCTVSLKFLMTMICGALSAIWIIAKTYHEAQEKQRRQHETYKIAAITTITIFIGQIIWIALTRLAKHLKWERWIKQELQTQKIRTPKQRALAAMRQKSAPKQTVMSH